MNLNVIRDPLVCSEQNRRKAKKLRFSIYLKNEIVE